MVEIVQQNNPILRKIAKAVPINDISSIKIQNIIKNMKEALASQKDGVAIAAPQIGVSLRIFVVSGLILKQADEKYKDIEKDLIFINPEISKLSRKKETVEEGCLSVRWLYGKISRSIKATIKAYDENGNLFERGASGILAQIFQHETDHLNGILFTDNAKDIEEINPKEK
ncbi:MAG: peptide deformylase [Patescibacteria group bacterium]|nr:peptide deformylase [Patescibacteria group bacterium]